MLKPKITYSIDGIRKQFTAKRAVEDLGLSNKPIEKPLEMPDWNLQCFFFHFLFCRKIKSPNHIKKVV